MYCNHCGSQQDVQGARFCNACGGALPTIQSAPMPATPITPIPGSQRQPRSEGFTLKQVLVGVVVSLAGLLIFIQAAGAFLDRVKTPEKSQDAAVEPSPSPSATATPNISPAEHLAEAKKLIHGEYDKENYEAAVKHLSAIPSTARESKQADALTKKVAKTFLYEEAAGDRPQTWSYDGRTMCVDRYLKRALNDYDSAEYVQWGEPEKVRIKGITYWRVGLKLRAKNGFGAKILTTKFFLIQNDQVVKMID